MFTQFFGASSLNIPRPSNIALATSSSGNYNNAVIIAGENVGTIENGSNFSSGRLTISMAAGAVDTAYVFKSYMRIGSGTASNFNWDATIGMVNWALGVPPSIEGSSLNQQDTTTEVAGIGEYLVINDPPDAGDNVTIVLDCQARNGAGAGTATLELEVTFAFT